MTRFPAVRDRLSISILLAACLALVAGTVSADEPRGLEFEQLAALRTVLDVALSPDGELAAYRLSVPRKPGEDDDGPAWTELHVASTGDGGSRPFVTGEVNVADVRFTPDGKRITFLAKRADDEHTALWAIPIGGGEARRWLSFESKIEEYRVSPDGRRIAFLAREPEDEEKKKRKEKGYKQQIFEEDWRPRRVWIAEAAPFYPAVVNPAVENLAVEGDEATESDEDEEAEEAEEGGPIALELEGSAFDFEWSPDGKRLAVTLAPTPLIDDRYMARRIHIVDAMTAEVGARIENPGKLGSYRFSPDGGQVAMISAADPNDTKAGRLMIAPVDGGEPRDLMTGLEGHVTAFGWRDSGTLIFVADVGTETRFGEVEIAGGKTKTHLESGGPDQPILHSLSHSEDGTRVAFVAESAVHPREVYFMARGDNAARRLTDSNPWLAEVALAAQETVRWKARDGLELEGVLVRPLRPSDGTPAPLILMVHGGPEGNDRNGWVTSYSRPGQIAAARGFAVLYPNYRGSTGRGVEFAKTSQGDAAGKEFDDLVDAVNHLVDAGIADRERVGINGGSYGGYATAWCATRLSEHFRAGVMFVGISNKLSKGLTTEIPVEDMMVHTRFDPWTRWEFSLERSPIYHAENSRTALLIATGTKDSRVHPSQSLQLYRALKLIGNTPVRFVRYPGEGHGNRRAAARDDYTRRLIRWMEHFLIDGDTELPSYELDYD